MQHNTYWLLNTNNISSEPSTPKDCSILIIGSGLTGVSVAHFLYPHEKDLTIVDCGSENASYYRNAGHILHGASESYKAMSDIHGREKTKAIFKFSESFCKELENTVNLLNIDCDYSKGQYLTVAKDSKEAKELEDSIVLMKEDGFDYNELITDLAEYRISDNFEAAKVCNLSAQANPAKFRNSLLKDLLKKGVKYHSQKIKEINPQADKVIVKYEDGTQSTHDAVVIAANAYAPLFSEFFATRKLIEPFKGQIITSTIMKDLIPRFQFSMDHGYIYGTTTRDNRFLIGGWRNNVPGGEVGTYSLEINKAVELGLKEFVRSNFNLPELDWEYSWSGIMGSSSTGLPFIGPTNSPLVFTCSGCTGYGFGWFHGSAKLLTDIMFGNSLTQGYQYFNPTKIGR